MYVILSTAMNICLIAWLAWEHRDRSKLLKHIEFLEAEAEHAWNARVERTK